MLNAGHTSFGFILSSSHSGTFPPTSKYHLPWRWHWRKAGKQSHHSLLAKARLLRTVLSLSPEAHWRRAAVHRRSRVSVTPPRSTKGDWGGAGSQVTLSLFYLWPSPVPKRAQWMCFLGRRWWQRVRSGAMLCPCLVARRVPLQGGWHPKGASGSVTALGSTSQLPPK